MLQNDYIHINDLVEKVKNNDTNALWELFDFYKPVINICVNKVHQKYTSVEREDLFSECIFVLKDLCSKFDSEKSYFSYYFDSRLQPYLVSKVKSKYLEKIKTIELNDEYSYEFDIISEIDEKHTIHSAVESLPDHMKKVIDLIYFKNLTQTESAKIMNISQPAFNKKLKAALKRLKNILENKL